MQNRNGISQNSFSSVSPLMFVSLCTYHFFTEKLFWIALNGLSNATQSKAIKQKCSQRKFVHRMNWADTRIHFYKRNTEEGKKVYRWQFEEMDVLKWTRTAFLAKMSLSIGEYNHIHTRQISLWNLKSISVEISKMNEHNFSQFGCSGISRLTRLYSKALRTK